jgi:arginyl-tRNA synthetase
MIQAYKEHFALLLQDKIGVPLEEILDIIEISPDNIPGDLAFPCFQLSKVLKKSPAMIAEDLKNQLSSPYFSKFEVIGPYLNAHINTQKFISDVFENEENLPGTHDNQNTKVLIEYMSANPNKPLHIGQARNICIGDTMKRIYSQLGYETHTSNYGDDSGVNVGYNIVGHLHYGLPITSDKKFDHYCGEIYTQMRAKDEDPEFKKLLSETLLKIEE